MTRPTLANVRGVVLCAGLGSRLRPATNLTPKPAVPFLGLPIAMHSMQALTRAGVDQLGANVHYLPAAMAAALEPVRAAGHRLAISEERGDLLGTGGGVREVWKQVGTDNTLVVCHGDVVLDVDLGEVLAAHQASGAAATLVLKVRDGSISLRGVFADDSGRVVGILDHRAPDAPAAVTEYAFTGVQVLSPALYPLLAEDGPYCLVTQLYPAMLAAGLTIGSFRTEAFYADLGTYERFLEAQHAAFDRPQRMSVMAWPTERAPGVWVEETVRLEAGAELRAPVMLRGDVVVRSGAQVGPYVSVSGAVELGAKAHVRDAAVWGRGRLDGLAHGGLFALDGGEHEG